MEITLGELAAAVGGEVVGDPGLVICGASPLASAAAGEITMVDSSDRKREFEQRAPTAIVRDAEFAEADVPSIVVGDVHAAFATIVSRFRPPRETAQCGISRSAHVSPTARIAGDVNIHPGATVGDDVYLGRGTTVHAGAHVMAGCAIGCDVTIFPGAVLYENTRVGDRSTIHAGAVLGAHGFGYRQVEGKHRLSAQLGYVDLGSDVEIGANSTVDRGTYGATVIGDGTKIDNLVQIAHNCHIGRHNMICSQVGIAGSTTSGDYVVFAGQVGVRDHVHIGQGAILCAMAGVSNDVPENAVMLGAPATREREFKVKQAALAKLPELRKEFRRLQQQVEKLGQHTEEQQAAQVGGQVSPGAAPSPRPDADRAA